MITRTTSNSVNEKAFKAFPLNLYGDKNFQFIDAEDSYRLGYIQRKVSRPYSIINTMTEGMVEDFFGAWCSDSDDEDEYNPDANWRIIFPVP